jgi:hypothetical protein
VSALRALKKVPNSKKKWSFDPFGITVETRSVWWSQEVIGKEEKRGGSMISVTTRIDKVFNVQNARENLGS